MKKRLGEILVDGGAIRDDQLSRVLELQSQAKASVRLGDLAVEYGFCTYDDIVNALSSQLKLPIAELSVDDLDLDVLDQTDEDFCRRFSCVPFEITQTSEGRTLHAAMVDPTDERTRRRLMAQFDADDLALQVTSLRPLLKLVAAGFEAATTRTAEKDVDVLRADAAQISRQSNGTLVEFRDLIVAELDSRLTG